MSRQPCLTKASHVSVTTALRALAPTNASTLLPTPSQIQPCRAPSRPRHGCAEKHHELAGRRPGELGEAAQQRPGTSDSALAGFGRVSGNCHVFGPGCSIDGLSLARAGRAGSATVLDYGWFCRDVMGSVLAACWRPLENRWSIKAAMLRGLDNNT